jgi:hypothetical protein
LVPKAKRCEHPIDDFTTVVQLSELFPAGTRLELATDFSAKFRVCYTDTPRRSSRIDHLQKPIHLFRQTKGCNGHALNSADCLPPAKLRMVNHFPLKCDLGDMRRPFVLL